MVAPASAPAPAPLRRGKSGSRDAGGLEAVSSRATALAQGEASASRRARAAAHLAERAAMSLLTSGQGTEATNRVSRIEAKQARSKARKATKATKAAREAAAARAEEQAIAKFGLPPSPRRSPRRRAQVEAAQLAELLQSDIPSERQSVYEVLLSFTPDDAECAVALVAPLATVSVQSVDVVSAEEYRRSALALAHLISLDCAAIGAEWLKDEKCLATYRVRGNALDVALSKGPDEM
eukprot:COSAG02_NODE_16914_length_1045_cov_1.113108_1_plen_236_part_10